MPMDDKEILRRFRKDEDFNIDSVLKEARASAVIDWLESEEAVGLVEPEYDDERCLTEIALERAFKKVAAKLREKKKKED